MIYQTLFTLAQASKPDATQTSALGSMLIPFICIGVIFYFLIIRPQTKRQKEQEKLIKSLKTGDKVVTSGGIHGLIANVKETTVIIKIADSVKIEVDKSAVSVVSKKPEEAAAAS